MNKLVYMINYFFKLKKSYIIFLVISEILVACSIILTSIMPKYIINEIFYSKNLNRIIFYVLFYIIIIFILNVVSAFSRYFAERSKDVMFKNHSISFAERTINTEYKNLENSDYLRKQDLANKAVNSYGFAGINLLLAQLIGKIFLLSTMLILIAKLNIFLALVLIPFFVFKIIIEYINKNKIEEIEKNSIDHKRKYNYLSSLNNNLKFAKDIRLYMLNNFILDLCREAYNKLLCYTRAQSNKKALYLIIIEVLNLLQLIISYSYLVYASLVGNIKMGDFFMYVGIITTINVFVGGLLSNLIDMKMSMKYADDFRAFIEMHQKINTGNATFKEQNFSIEFKNVSFKYKNSDKYALKNISVKFESGEKVSIVGENGAGKSTFIKLLTGLYRPTSGEILINNQNINEINTEDFYNLFSVIYQDFRLFALPVRENIILTKDEDKEKINNLIKSVGLSERFDKLSSGLDTIMSREFGGEEFSGGELQKIAMIRALYKDAPIIILDEPTASMDVKAEHKFFKEFKEIQKDKLSFLISHRMSNSDFCDKILVIKNGMLVEVGNHSKLMTNNSYYAEMFNLQASLYSEVI